MSISHPLIFVRHGATPWNEAARYQGRTETEISAHGVDQVRANARLIKSVFNSQDAKQDLGNLRNWQIVSSPLKRAQQSANLVGETLRLENAIPTIEPKLAEIAMGRWEGLDSQQVKAQFYEERKGRKSDRWHFKPKGGESLAERHNDVTVAVQNLKPHTIVITHAGILRIISHILGNMNEADAAALALNHVGIFHWDGKTLEHIK